MASQKTGQSSITGKWIPKDYADVVLQRLAEQGVKMTIGRRVIQGTCQVGLSTAPEAHADTQQPRSNPQR